METPTEVVAGEAQPNAPTFYTDAELIDLRRRVLANEEVTDEELRIAIDSLTNRRGVAPLAKAKGGKAPTIQLNLGDAMAKFKASRGL